MKVVTPAAKRIAVAHLVAVHEMSERRACQVIGADHSLIRYRSTGPHDTALRTRMRALATERRRFGNRRLHVLLRKERPMENCKRTQRVYREERLTVGKHRGRKRATGTRADPSRRRTERSMLGRLSARPACRRKAPTGTELDRRRDQRMPGGRGGLLDLGQASRQGAGGLRRATG